MRLLWADLPVEIARGCPALEMQPAETPRRILCRTPPPEENPCNRDLSANDWDAECGPGVDFVVGHFVTGPETQYGLSKIASPGSNHDVTYALTLGYRF